LRVAQIEQLAGRHPDAIAGFMRVAEGETQYWDAPCMPELAARARDGLIGSYAVVGKPDRAFDFFHRVSGERSDESAHTLRMMVRLVDLLAIRGSSDALVVMREISSRRTDASICEALQAVVRERFFLQTHEAKDLAARCVPRPAP
jgi:hypothetical protein